GTLEIDRLVGAAHAIAMSIDRVLDVASADRGAPGAARVKPAHTLCVYLAPRLLVRNEPLGRLQTTRAQRNFAGADGERGSHADRESRCPRGRDHAAHQ